MDLRLEVQKNEEVAAFQRTESLLVPVFLMPHSLNCDCSECVSLQKFEEHGAEAFEYLSQFITELYAFIAERQPYLDAALKKFTEHIKTNVTSMNELDPEYDDSDSGPLAFHQHMFLRYLDIAISTIDEAKRKRRQIQDARTEKIGEKVKVAKIQTF